VGLIWFLSLGGAFFEGSNRYVYSVCFARSLIRFRVALGPRPEEAPADYPEHDDDGQKKYDKHAFSHLFSSVQDCL
jgi:hypothetical protein